MILALDFDGVVWDSVGECYQMARRAYRELLGKEAAECEPAFRSGRWLVRCGGEFLLLLELAFENNDLSGFSKDEWAQKAAANEARLLQFEPVFYRHRQLCRENETQAWLAMQSAYPEFLEELPRLQEAFTELVVCTTKDEASARQLLETVGLKLSIWAKEHGVHKGEQIRDLCQKRGVAATEICFVDDLLDNLEQVEPTGARLFLADWGYNTPAEQAAARARGIPVVSVKGLAAQLCSA